MNVKIQTGECLYIQLDECLPKQTDIMDLRLRSCKGRDRQITEREREREREGGRQRKSEREREYLQ